MSCTCREYLRKSQLTRSQQIIVHVFKFQLYTEVQARRGANDVTTENPKNDTELECGFRHQSNGLYLPSHHSKSHPGATTHHYSNACSYDTSGCSYPMSQQNGSGVSEIGDLLQDYLGQGKELSQKNNGARHVVSRGESHFTALCFYWYLHI